MLSRTSRFALSLSFLVLALRGVRLNANDSTVAVSAGGLVLTKTEAIAMVSETLEISTDEILVRYEFRNVTRRAITTRVAFPIPEFEYDENRDYNMDLESDNPFGFRLLVDGRPRPFETERVFKDGRLRYTHHWTQRFPAGRIVKVEHRYRASVGFRFWLPTDEQPKYPEFITELKRDYCADTDRINRNSIFPDSIPAVANDIHYILTTANNWRGPIGKFSLIIHPPRGVLMYTCFEGLNRTPTGDYRFEREKFSPERELLLLFVTLNGEKAQRDARALQTTN